MADPRRVHDAEQMLAAITQVAGLVSGYFHELVKHGLTREEALALTIEYQKIFARSARDGS